VALIYADVSLRTHSVTHSLMLSRWELHLRWRFKQQCDITLSSTDSLILLGIFSSLPQFLVLRLRRPVTDHPAVVRRPWAGVCAARVEPSTATRWRVDSRPADAGMWNTASDGSCCRAWTCVYWRCRWRHQYPAWQLWLE